MPKAQKVTVNRFCGHFSPPSPPAMAKRKAPSSPSPPQQQQQQQPRRSSRARQTVSYVAMLAAGDASEDDSATTSIANNNNNNNDDDEEEEYKEDDEEYKEDDEEYKEEEEEEEGELAARVAAETVSAKVQQPRWAAALVSRLASPGAWAEAGTAAGPLARLPFDVLLRIVLPESDSMAAASGSMAAAASGVMLMKTSRFFFYMMTSDRARLKWLAFFRCRFPTIASARPWMADKQVPVIRLAGFVLRLLATRHASGLGGRRCFVSGAPAGYKNIGGISTVPGLPPGLLSRSDVLRKLWPPRCPPSVLNHIPHSSGGHGHESSFLVFDVRMALAYDGKIQASVSRVRSRELKLTKKLERALGEALGQRQVSPIVQKLFMRQNGLSAEGVADVLRGQKAFKADFIAEFCALHPKMSLFKDGVADRVGAEIVKGNVSRDKAMACARAAAEHLAANEYLFSDDHQQHIDDVVRSVRKSFSWSPERHLDSWERDLLAAIQVQKRWIRLETSWAEIRTVANQGPAATLEYIGTDESLRSMHALNTWAPIGPTGHMCLKDAVIATRILLTKMFEPRDYNENEIADWVLNCHWNSRSDHMGPRLPLPGEMGVFLLAPLAGLDVRPFYSGLAKLFCNFNRYLFTELGIDVRHL